MKKIGFIGLGAMGNPIAINLQNAGFPLYLTCHRSTAPAKALEEKGAVICRSNRELAQQADVVFTVLPSDVEVEQVIFGEEGLLSGARPGLVIIDLSTCDLVRSRELAARLGEKGVVFLDAPISGGVKGAQDGTLVIMVGGDKAVCDDCADIFAPIAKKVVYCGGSGLGLAAKAANNLIAATEMVAISEALSLAVKAGIDPADMIEVLKGGTANSFILNSKANAILTGDYSPKFRLELMCKDLNIITGAAKKLGSPALVASTVEQVFNICKAQHGGEDSIAVSRFYMDHAGVSFAAKKDE